MLDVLVYVCGVLVLIGGLLLGYLGVAGGFTNQRVLALWILYGTLFFVLTGAFFYFLKRLKEPEANTSARTKTRPPIRGLLIPANDPSPPHNCRQPPNAHKTIYFGTGVATMSDEMNAFGLITMAGEEVFSLENTPTGILINATLRNKSGNVVATIEKNVFNSKSTFEYEATNPDQHSLLVLDSNNQIVLYVRYLNPQAIKILGTFYHPKRPLPVVMEENSLSIGSMSMKTFCIGEIGIWKGQSGIVY